MNKKYKISIIALIISNFYIASLYFEQKEQCKSISIYPIKNSAYELIGLLEKPEFLKIQLLAESSVYFEKIGKNDKRFVNSLNKNICVFWTNNTKQKINTLLFAQNELDNNTSSLIYIKKGINVIENLCI